MSDFKSADSRREEFRKYLDRSGVMDALTKSLVKLYEEEQRPGPEEALSYVLKQLGGVRADEYEAAQKIINDLEQQIASLKPEVEIDPSVTSSQR